MTLTADQRLALQRQLAKAQQSGFVGKGDLDAHIDHALGFIDPIAVQRPSRSLDLGSGGGLPGLVLAMALPDQEWYLVDSNKRRVDELAVAVAELGLDRVQVVHGRAEDLARETELRGSFDCVVSRSFGPPAVTAECASGFLAEGGCLIVSEPPEPSPDRWPAAGLAKLGLEAAGSPAGLQMLIQRELCPDEYPRRAGVPEKRPIF